MVFSGKLVEPTKLDKITLRQAAISFNKGKKTPNSKQKERRLSLSLKLIRKRIVVVAKWKIVLMVTAIAKKVVNIVVRIALAIKKNVETWVRVNNVIIIIIIIIIIMN